MNARETGDAELEPVTEEAVREAFAMTGDGLDFKAVARARGRAFDEWLDGVRVEAKAQALEEMTVELATQGGHGGVPMLLVRRAKAIRDGKP